ncbi:C40 family peptidase [Mycobacteroides abscessus]|uniref:C40 family peptidase n=1 Tax=Mycobacteroides abscessus TaxID=36809 RepID=UPI0009269ACC|nr:NlpC/P60 family protein [Mycobacteroides abscessus]SIC22037.1 cell wall-associated hydrolase, invasion-associated protein [Mycobacteroides abscessus subsp. abscessus]
MVDGFVSGVGDVLARVRGLFGSDVVVAGHGTGSTGYSRGGPDWSGTTSEREQGAVRALDARRDNLIRTDRALDNWARDTAENTRIGRGRADAIIAGYENDVRALAGPARTSLAARTALVDALGAHLDNAGNLVSSQGQIIATRREMLAAIAAEYTNQNPTKPAGTQGDPRNPRDPRNRPGTPPRLGRQPTGTLPSGQPSGGASGGGFQIPKGLTSAFSGMGSGGGSGSGGGGGTLPGLSVLSGLGGLGAGGPRNRDGRLRSLDALGDGGPAGPAADKAVAFAKRQIGKPYIWGGVGPVGYDCSGLVMEAYREGGIVLPHHTYEQMRVGTPVNPNNIIAGDRIYANFKTGPGRPEHVLLAISPTQAIEAPTPGQRIHITNIPMGNIQVRRGG